MELKIEIEKNRKKIEIQSIENQKSFSIFFSFYYKNKKIYFYFHIALVSWIWKVKKAVKLSATKAKCLVCEKEINMCNGSTTSIANHLRTHGIHPPDSSQ